MASYEPFQDIADEDVVPLVSVSNCNNIDGFLRRAGIICQKGRLNGNLVEYDARVWVQGWQGGWVYPATRKPIYDDYPGLSKESVEKMIQHRSDTQPGCVIRVVGSVNFSEFVTSAEQRRQIEKRRIMEKLMKLDVVRERLPMLAQYQHHSCSRRGSAMPTRPGSANANAASPHHLRPMSADMHHRRASVERPLSALAEKRKLKSHSDYQKRAIVGYEGLLDQSDEDEMVGDQPPALAKDPDKLKKWRRSLKSSQLAMYIRQYLQRSIPKCARKLDALVITNDSVVVTKDENGPIKEVTPTDLTKALNKGMMANKEGERKKKHQHKSKGSCEAHGGNPILVGVHPCTKWVSEEDSLIPMVCESLGAFTNHVLLTRTVESPNGTKQQHPARRAEVLQFTDKVVSDLCNGYTVDPKLTTPQPPERGGAWVCTVVIGGDTSTAMLELLRSAENSWPILVVEGSGGYADVIASTIRRVEEVVGAPSMDDYRNFLGTINPMTAKIVNSGCVTLIPKGTSAEEFERIIEKSLCPDETLHQAWLKYATWDYNTQYCRQLFLFQQVLGLLLGILATTLSILQTFLQLQYPGETGVTSNKQGSSTIGQVYSWVGLVVVILPVGLSLVEAVENKLNAGGRWVALRAASEQMLREIYMYRTQVRSYSQEEIKRSNDSGVREEEDEPLQRKEATDSEEVQEHNKVKESFGRTDHLRHTSRAEKLSHWMERLTTDLKEGETSTNTLRDYRGPLPPYHILETGDQGWNILTPDEYIQYRLKPLSTRYEAAAEHYEKQLSRFNILNYCLYAAGTLLAALSSLAALKKYNLQAWVALTTGMSNAGTRYMDYARIDFLQTKSIKMKMELSDVMSWWGSRGEHADSHQTRNELVLKVETLVTEEFIDWGGQMKKAMEKAKKEKREGEKETKEMMEKLKSGQDLDQVKKIKEIGLENLNAKMLAQALENPTGPEAKQVFTCLERLNDQVEESIGVDMKEEVMEAKIVQEVTKKIELLKTIPEQFLNEAGQLLDINLGGIQLSDFVPADLLAITQDASLRQKMFRDITKGDLSVLSRDQCLQFFNRAGRVVKDKVSELSQRQMLEVLKESAIEEMHRQLLQGLENINVGLYDLVPNRSKVEELLMELRDISRIPWREMPSANIIDLFKDHEIREKFAGLKEVTLRGVLKRADKVLNVEDSPLSQMVTSIMQKISQLDTEELFGTPQLKAEIFDTIEELGSTSVWLLGKNEILQKLPRAVRELEHVKNKTQGQLVEYIQTVQTGFSVSRVFKAFKAEYESRIGDIRPDPVFNALLHNRALCDRFVFAIKGVPQMDINRFDKKTLMKKLSMTPSLTLDMVEELKYLKEGMLKELMSGLKAYMSNSYHGRVFDILCDEVTSFDLRNLLPDAEDREKLVNRVREFKGIDVANTSKQQLITTLAFQTLVVKFLKLSEAQIREVIERALMSMSNSFHNAVFCQAISIHSSPDFVNQARLDLWDEESVDRLCMCLVRLPESFGEFCEKKLLAFENHADEDLLGTVRDELCGMLPEPLVKLFASWEAYDMLHVFHSIRLLIGEPVTSNIFEAASRVLGDQNLVGRFQAVFSNSHWRDLLLDCFHQVEGTPFVDLVALSPTHLINVLINYPAEGHEKRHAFLSDLCQIFDRDHTSKDNTIIPSTLRSLVLHVLNELFISLPYLVFLRTCLQIAAFDLREIVDDPQTRRLLTVLLLRCHIDGRITMVDGVVQQSAHEILDACDEYLGYDMVVNDMRMMSEEQLKMVAARYLEFFGTKVGRLFASMVKIKETVTEVKYEVLMETISSIKSELILHPSKVRRDLRQFDAEQFFTVLTEDEKITVFRRYVPDDSNVHLLAGFSYDQLRRLFAHLQAIPHLRDGQSAEKARQPLNMSMMWEKWDGILKEVEQVISPTQNWKEGFITVGEEDLVSDFFGAASPAGPSGPPA